MSANDTENVAFVESYFIYYMICMCVYIHIYNIYVHCHMIKLRIFKNAYIQLVSNWVLCL